MERYDEIQSEITNSVQEAYECGLRHIILVSDHTEIGDKSLRNGEITALAEDSYVEAFRTFNAVSEKNPGTYNAFIREYDPKKGRVVTAVIFERSKAAHDFHNAMRSKFPNNPKLISDIAEYTCPRSLLAIVEKPSVA